MQENLKKNVKAWVVRHSRVINPYSHKTWFAAITISLDINGEGDSIEKAYQDLTNRIMKSEFLLAELKQFPSFNKIVNGK